MKIIACLLIPLFFLAYNCSSQDSATSVLHINKLPAEGVVLDKGWKFTDGDNPAYANPAYDDSKWRSINPTLDIHDLPPIIKSGIFWLRLHLSIDSNLLKEQLASMIAQSGASEIYLNGRLLYKFGTVSTKPDEIKAYDPSGKPVSIPFDKSKAQVLAVRYILQPHLLYTTAFLHTNHLLDIRVNQIDRSFDQYLYISSRTRFNFFRVGVFFIFAILHLAFFLYYPAQKANLYFSLYSLFFAVSDLCQPDLPHEVRYIFYIANFSLGIYQLGVFFLLTALYSLLEQKRGWIYWGLLVATITGIFLNSWGYPSHWRVSVFLINSIVNFEMVRVAFKALKRKQRGAWIIAAGAINFSIFWITFVLSIIFSYLDIHLSSTFTIFDLVFNFSILSIPVATSIYLALDFAFTTRELKNKLSEVQKLSSEKQQILTAQKEMLEQQVAERTSELNQSLEDLKSTQSQLIQSEKMASLGELTAGIAHEIQNPLNFVNNFSEINTELIEELKSELLIDNKEEALLIADDIKDNEQKIIHHGKRADSIVKGMLQHSRASTGKKEFTDINALVDECIRLSYHGMRAKDKEFNAAIKTDLDGSIGKVNIVPQDISRVLLNLLNNAFYAVDEKKRRLDGMFEPAVSVCTKKLDGKVEIHVKDNGNGVPQNIVDKIFQPFFTTKPTGQGTGLGLSLSYDIIKAHGGDIKVESKEGDGSEFIVKLPN